MKKEEFRRGFEDYYFEKYKDTAGITKAQLQEKNRFKLQRFIRKNTKLSN